MLDQSSAGSAPAPTAPDLVLERLPSGEYAWLRRELDTAIRDADQLDRDMARTLGSSERRDEGPPDSRRYVITQAGRDYLARERALENLFGPWPTVAEASTLEEVA